MPPPPANAAVLVSPTRNGDQTNRHSGGSGSGSKRLRLTGGGPDLLSTPGIAYPTVVVFIVAQIIFWASTYALVNGASRWLTVPVSAVCIFVLFTPMHDSVHGSVFSVFPDATDKPAGSGLPRAVRVVLNGLVGRVVSYYFLAPFPAFRYVHLQHHKHTNDPHRDPDYWSGTKPAILMPLRWFSQELHYYVPFFQNLRSHSTADIIESLITLVVEYGLLIKYWPLYGQLFLFGWMIPLRLAVGFLAYSFDYVPHRPHATTRDVSEYGTTSRVDGVFSVGTADATGGTSWWLTYVLLCQNYHNIHHLYPSIPFYRYPNVWNSNRQQLVAAGTPIEPLYSRRTAWLY